MRALRFITIGWGIVVFIQPIAAQTSPPGPFHAKIYPDSSEFFIHVMGVQLDFRFVGIGVYAAEDYPSLSSIPLENGQRIAFENITRMTLRPVRVFWKKYLEPSKRRATDEIDRDGYCISSSVEVDAAVTTWDGTVIRSRIHHADPADIFITGTTDLGDYQLQLDQENGKSVRVEFEPVFIMQCTSDLTHLFPNRPWSFCPICGAALRRISKPENR